MSTVPVSGSSSFTMVMSLSRLQGGEVVLDDAVHIGEPHLEGKQVAALGRLIERELFAELGLQTAVSP
jgi:hypothetical protein